MRHLLRLDVKLATKTDDENGKAMACMVTSVLNDLY